MQTLGVTLSLNACGPSAPRADASRGHALATTLGCHDCHGGDLAGHKVSHDDTIAVLYSANLTRAAPIYSDAQLRTVLTTGLRPDGTRLWQTDAAPYAALSEADMSHLIAYLRGLTPIGAPHPRIKTTQRSAGSS